MDYKNIAIAGVDFGVPSDGTTDAAPALNAVMAQLATRGGGIVDLPMPTLTVGSTLDNQYSRVFLRGSGRSSEHTGGAPVAGTTIVPTFAGTVLKHRSPYGSTLAQNVGGGFTGLRVVGNGVATRLLEIDSIREGEYDLFLEECVGPYSAVLACGVSGVSLAENTNIYMAQMRLAFRQLTGSAGSAALLMTGSSNANVTACDMVLRFLIGGGMSALEIQDADNNHIDLHVYRATGGVGNGLVSRGKYSASSGYARANLFRHISSNAPLLVEGTNTGGVLTASNGICHFLDKENATPNPTVGTGASFPFITNLGQMRGFTTI